MRVGYLGFGGYRRVIRRGRKGRATSEFVCVVPVER